MLGALLLSVGLVLSLRWIDPPTSGVAISRRLQAWTEGRDNYQPQHCWRDLGAMGTAMPMSVIASEDQRFAAHHGFDLVELSKAIDQATRGHRLRGASTISQQTAKNLFLWPGRSWMRKGLEVWFTALIEVSWSKSRILEIYLNVIEFGDGVYGACAASRQQFGKDVANLSPMQAALLAATLPNPHKYIANAPTEEIAARAGWIIRQVQNLGGVTYLKKLGADSGDAKH
jgi:monofunctional biosynthetic peptidoglycan transglycosylase